MKKRGILSFLIYLLALSQLLFAFINELIALQNPDDDLAGFALAIITWLLLIFCIPFIFKLLHFLTGCKIFAICTIIADAYIVYMFGSSIFYYDRPDWNLILIACLFSLSFISNLLSLFSGRD